MKNNKKLFFLVTIVLVIFLILICCIGCNNDNNREFRRRNTIDDLYEEYDHWKSLVDLYDLEGDIDNKIAATIKLQSVEIDILALQIPMDAPTNLRIENDKLLWDGSEDESYLLSINGESWDVSPTTVFHKTSYDLGFHNGNSYTIQVKTAAKNRYYRDSEAVGPITYSPKYKTINVVNETGNYSLRYPINSEETYSDLATSEDEFFENFYYDKEFNNVVDLYNIIEDNKTIYTKYKDFIIENGKLMKVYDKLIDIHIPRTVNIVNGEAFEHCHNINNIFIPNTVTSISDKFTFYLLKNVNIYFESSQEEFLGDKQFLKYIGSGSRIYWGQTDIFVSNNFLYGIKNDGTLAVNGFSDKSANIISLIIPENVKYGEKTFTVTSISEDAFNNIPTIKSITLPDSIIKIEDGCFAYCYDVIELNLGKGLKYIGSNALAGFNNIENINLPNGLISIGNHAFAGCHNMKSIDLPDTLRSIGSRAFYNSGLVDIFIPISVTEMGSFVFEKCASLCDINCEAQHEQLNWDSEWYCYSTFRNHNVSYGCTKDSSKQWNNM